MLLAQKKGTVYVSVDRFPLTASINFGSNQKIDTSALKIDKFTDNKSVIFLLTEVRKFNRYKNNPKSTKNKFCCQHNLHILFCSHYLQIVKLKYLPIFKACNVVDLYFLFSSTSSSTGGSWFIPCASRYSLPSTIRTYIHNTQPTICI